jgi:CHAT domain-containing protein/Flp pilus assembly protein TadD
MISACLAGLLLVAAGPGQLGTPRVVTIELYNASGEFLPRIDEASERALRDLVLSGGFQTFSPEDLARALAEHSIATTQVADDPKAAAILGRALKGDFLVTGTIVEFTQESETQSLRVEFVVVRVADGTVRLRRRYTGQQTTSGTRKLHRELLAKILNEARPELLTAMGGNPADKEHSLRLADEKLSSRINTELQTPPAEEAPAKKKADPGTLGRSVYFGGREPPPTFGEQAEQAARARESTRPRPPAEPPRPASELLAEGNRRVQGGMIPSAWRYFVNAWRAALEAKDPATVTAAHAGLCGLKFAQSPFQLAHCWTALEGQKRSGDRAAEAWTRIQIGKYYSDFGPGRDAKGEFEQALDIARTLHNPKLSAESEEALGSALGRQGELEAGHSHLTKALEIWRTQDNPVQEAATLIRLGEIDNDLGRFREAANHLEDALNVYQHAEGIAGIDLNKLIEEIKRKGTKANFDPMFYLKIPLTPTPRESEGYSQLVEQRYAERMQKILHEPTSTPGSLEDRGGAIRRQVEEEVKAEIARSQQSPIESAMPPDETYLANLKRAWNVSLLGASQAAAALFDSLPRYSAAMMLYQQEQLAIQLEMAETASPITILTALPPNEMCPLFEQSEILGDLAALYQRLGETEHATQERDSAWIAWEKTSGAAVEEYERILYRSLLTEGTSGAKQKIGVSWLYGKAREAGLPPPPSIANGICGRRVARWRDLSLRVRSLDSAGDAQQARRIYQGLLSQAGAEDQALVLAGVARLQAAGGNTREAIETYQKAVEWVEIVLGGLRSQPIEYASLHAPIYAELISLLVARGDTDLAFAFSERARAFDLRRQLGGVRFAGIPTSDIVALQELEQRLVEVRELLAPGSTLDWLRDSNPDLQHSIESLLKKIEGERAELLAKIERLHPQAASILGRHTVTLADLQHQILGADSTLIVYFVTELETFAWVVERDAARLVRLPTGRAELAAKIEYLRNELGRGTFDRATADWLYRRLLSPLEPFLRHPNLLLVPHGPLHALPFAALWSEAQGRYALEKRTFTVAPSGTALQLLRSRRTPFSGSALVLGNPDGSLPASAIEAKSVGQLLGTTPLLGDDAQVSRLREEAGRADILHVAAHGFFLPHDPFASYVQLAPAGEKGRLLVKDVISLDLAQTDLVVLSACSTGKGRVRESDDVVGMTWAFLAAGAPTVITALWPIDDEASAALMTSFYRHLMQPGTQAAEALRAAQAEVRSRQEWSSPYFWAGFVLYGVDEVLAAPSRSSGGSYSPHPELGLLSLRGDPDGSRRRISRVPTKVGRR